MEEKFTNVKIQNVMLNKGLTQEEAWKIMRPVCRELSDLVNGGYIQLISGSYNEREDVRVLLLGELVKLLIGNFNDLLLTIILNSTKNPNRYGFVIHLVKDYPIILDI